MAAIAEFGCPAGWDSSWPYAGVASRRMGSIWVESLGRNFDGALDLLADAVRDCTDELWETSMWDVPAPDTNYELRGPDGTAITEPAERRALVQRWSAPWSVAWHVLECFDYDLNGDLAPCETGVIEGSGKPGHARRHLPFRQAAPANRLPENLGGCREPVSERFRLDVFHARRNSPIRRELRDPAPHPAGAENSQARDFPGADRGVGDSRFLLDLLGREKDVEEVSLDRTSEDVGDPAALDFQGGVDRLA